MATRNDFPSRHPSRRAQERAPQDEVERWYRLVPPLFHLSPYRAGDEDAAIALWLATWQRAYPAIDFAARVPWWRERWRNELVPNAAIIVAEEAATLDGFVTIDVNAYLDPLWGSPRP